MEINNNSGNWTDVEEEGAYERRNTLEARRTRRVSKEIFPDVNKHALREFVQREKDGLNWYLCLRRSRISVDLFMLEMFKRSNLEEEDGFTPEPLIEIREEKISGNTVKGLTKRFIRGLLEEQADRSESIARRRRMLIMKLKWNGNIALGNQS